VLTILGTRRIFEGRVISVRVDEVRYDNGHRGSIEVVEHRGGVAIVARPDPAHIVLVRQYRPAPGRELWEVPAGKLEPGEEPLASAMRELAEETGYRCSRMRRLWSFYTSPGFSNELLHLYVAEGLTSGAAHTEDNEQIECRVFAIEDAWRMVTEDQLPDAKTQIALAWAQAQPR